MATKRARSIVLIVGVLLFVLFLLPAHIRPANFLPDDTYYYLQVAYNILHGHGSTFNRITPTNGYHPLWMLFCVFAMALAGGGKELAIHIVLVIQALLFLGVIYYFFKISKELAIHFWPVALPVLAAYFLTGLYGSEAHLNALTSLVALHYLLLAHRNGASRYWMMAGIFAGLAVLSRLDNIFFIGAIGLFGVLLRGGEVGENIASRNTLPRRLALFTVPAALVIAPYLIYNAVTFGHVVPISGAIKSSFPAIDFGIARLALLGKIVSLGAILSLIISFVPMRESRHAMLLRILGVATLMQSAYIALFVVRGAGWSWYYVIGVLNLAFLIATIADLIGERFGRVDNRLISRLAGAFIIFVTLAGLARGWYRIGDAYFTQRRSFFESVGEGSRNMRKDLALWLKEHFPPESGVMAEEGAGTIGYYSGLRILPADGLAGDYSYNDDLVRLGAARYLSAHNVEYYLGVIAPTAEHERIVHVVAPLYRRSVGTLHLFDSNIIVQRKDHPQRFDVAVWRIEHGRK